MIVQILVLLLLYLHLQEVLVVLRMLYSTLTIRTIRIVLKQENN